MWAVNALHVAVSMGLSYKCHSVTFNVFLYIIYKLILLLWNICDEKSNGLRNLVTFKDWCKSVLHLSWQFQGSFCVHVKGRIQTPVTLNSTILKLRFFFLLSMGPRGEDILCLFCVCVGCFFLHTCGCIGVLEAYMMGK